MLDIITYDFKHLTDTKVRPEEYFINTYADKCLESEGKISSARRMRIILDAKYKKSDLNQVMDKQCQHLSPNNWEKLLHLMRKLESLFDGTLGTWNTVTVIL